MYGFPSGIRKETEQAIVSFIVNVIGLLFLLCIYYNYVILEAYFFALFWAAIASIPLFQVKWWILSLFYPSLVDENNDLMFQDIQQENSLKEESCISDSDDAVSVTSAISDVDKNDFDSKDHTTRNNVTHDASPSLPISRRVVTPAHLASEPSPQSSKADPLQFPVTPVRTIVHENDMVDEDYSPPERVTASNTQDINYLQQNYISSRSMLSPSHEMIDPPLQLNNTQNYSAITGHSLSNSNNLRKRLLQRHTPISSEDVNSPHRSVFATLNSNSNINNPPNTLLNIDRSLKNTTMHLHQDLLLIHNEHNDDNSISGKNRLNNPQHLSFSNNQQSTLIQNISHEKEDHISLSSSSSAASTAVANPTFPVISDSNQSSQSIASPKQISSAKMFVDGFLSQKALLPHNPDEHLKIISEDRVQDNRLGIVDKRQIQSDGNSVVSRSSINSNHRNYIKNAIITKQKEDVVVIRSSNVSSPSSQPSDGPQRSSSSSSVSPDHCVQNKKKSSDYKKDTERMVMLSSPYSSFSVSRSVSKADSHPEDGNEFHIINNNHHHHHHHLEGGLEHRDGNVLLLGPENHQHFNSNNSNYQMSMPPLNMSKNEIDSGSIPFIYEYSQPPVMQQFISEAHMPANYFKPPSSQFANNNYLHHHYPILGTYSHFDQYQQQQALFGPGQFFVDGDGLLLPPLSATTNLHSLSSYNNNSMNSNNKNATVALSNNNIGINENLDTKDNLNFDFIGDAGNRMNAIQSRLSTISYESLFTNATYNTTAHSARRITNRLRSLLSLDSPKTLKWYSVLIFVLIDPLLRCAVWFLHPIWQVAVATPPPRYASKPFFALLIRWWVVLMILKVSNHFESHLWLIGPALFSCLWSALIVLLPAIERVRALAFLTVVGEATKLTLGPVQKLFEASFHEMLALIILVSSLACCALFVAFFAFQLFQEFFLIWDLLHEFVKAQVADTNAYTGMIIKRFAEFTHSSSILSSMSPSGEVSSSASAESVTRAVSSLLTKTAAVLSSSSNGQGVGRDEFMDNSSINHVPGSSSSSDWLVSTLATAVQSMGGSGELLTQLATLWLTVVELMNDLGWIPKFSSNSSVPSVSSSSGLDIFKDSNSFEHKNYSASMKDNSSYVLRAFFNNYGLGNSSVQNNVFLAGNGSFSNNASHYNFNHAHVDTRLMEFVAGGANGLFDPSTINMTAFYEVLSTQKGIPITFMDRVHNLDGIIIWTNPQGVSRYFFPLLTNYNAAIRNDWHTEALAISRRIPSRNVNFAHNKCLNCCTLNSEAIEKRGGSCELIAFESRKNFVYKDIPDPYLNYSGSLNSGCYQCNQSQSFTSNPLILSCSNPSSFINNAKPCEAPTTVAMFPAIQKDTIIVHEGNETRKASTRLKPKNFIQRTIDDVGSDNKTINNNSCPNCYFPSIQGHPTNDSTLNIHDMHEHINEDEEDDDDHQSTITLPSFAVRFPVTYSIISSVRLGNFSALAAAPLAYSEVVARLQKEGGTGEIAEDNSVNLSTNGSLFTNGKPDSSSSIPTTASDKTKIDVEVEGKSHKGSPLKQFLDKVIVHLTSAGMTVGKSVTFSFLLVGQFLMSCFDMVVQIIVFLSGLYYLLCARLSLLQYIERLLSLVDQSGVVYSCVDRGIRAILLSSIKRVVFYVLFIWCAYTSAGIPIVFVPCAIVGVLALIPVVPPEVFAAVPIASLWLSEAGVQSVILLLSTTGIYWYVTTAIYAEIPDSSPWLVGLSVVLGVSTFGFKGLVIGPIVASIPLIIMSIISRFQTNNHGTKQITVKNNINSHMKNNNNPRVNEFVDFYEDGGAATSFPQLNHFNSPSNVILPRFNNSRHFQQQQQQQQHHFSKSERPLKNTPLSSILIQNQTPIPSIHAHTSPPYVQDPDSNHRNQASAVCAEGDANTMRTFLNTPTVINDSVMADTGFVPPTSSFTNNVTNNNSVRGMRMRTPVNQHHMYSNAAYSYLPTSPISMKSKSHKTRRFLPQQQEHIPNQSVTNEFKVHPGTPPIHINPLPNHSRQNSSRKKNNNISNNNNNNSVNRLLQEKQGVADPVHSSINANIPKGQAKTPNRTVATSQNENVSPSHIKSSSYCSSQVNSQKNSINTKNFTNDNAIVHDGISVISHKSQVSNMYDIYNANHVNTANNNSLQYVVPNVVFAYAQTTPSRVSRNHAFTNNNNGYHTSSQNISHASAPTSVLTPSRRVPSSSSSFLAQTPSSYNTPHHNSSHPHASQVYSQQQLMIMTNNGLTPVHLHSSVGNSIHFQQNPIITNIPTSGVVQTPLVGSYRNNNLDKVSLYHPQHLPVSGASTNGVSILHSFNTSHQEIKKSSQPLKNITTNISSVNNQNHYSQNLYPQQNMIPASFSSVASSSHPPLPASDLQFESPTNVSLVSDDTSYSSSKSRSQKTIRIEQNTISNLNGNNIPTSDTYPTSLIQADSSNNNHLPESVCRSSPAPPSNQLASLGILGSSHHSLNSNSFQSPVIGSPDGNRSTTSILKTKIQENHQPGVTSSRLQLMSPSPSSLSIHPSMPHSTLAPSNKVLMEVTEQNQFLSPPLNESFSSSSIQVDSVPQTAAFTPQMGTPNIGAAMTNNTVSPSANLTTVGCFNRGPSFSSENMRNIANDSNDYIDSAGTHNNLLSDYKNDSSTPSTLHQIAPTLSVLVHHPVAAPHSNSIFNKNKSCLNQSPAQPTPPPVQPFDSAPINYRSSSCQAGFSGPSTSFATRARLATNQKSQVSQNSYLLNQNSHNTKQDLGDGDSHPFSVSQTPVPFGFRPSAEQSQKQNHTSISKTPVRVLGPQPHAVTGLPICAPPELYGADDEKSDEEK